MSAEDKRIAQQCGMTFSEAAAAIQSAQGLDSEYSPPKVHMSHRVREAETETIYIRPKAPGDEW
jgi:hypothetical protein